MADKVGSVYIEASVDTTGVIQAGKAISGVADKMESDLKSVGNAADTMSDKLNESGKSVSRFGIELSTADQKLGRFIDLQGRVREATGRFTTGMLANGESVKSFNQNISAAGNETEKTGNKLSGFGRNATAVGVQLQDIAVQAQAGTSAFVILGQQGSQLASSFGPGGAVFGAVIAIASAIGGVLYESMKKAGKAMEELPEELQKQLDEIKSRYEEVDEASKAAFSQVELGKATAEHEKQESALIRLKKKHDEITEALRKQGKSSNLGLELTEKMIAKAEARLKGQTLLIEKLSSTLSEGAASGAKGISEEFDSDEKTAAELATQIKIATIRINDGELAARRFAASQVLGLKAVEMLPKPLDEAIDNLYKLEQQQLKDTEAAKERVKQAKELEKTLERIQRGEAQAEEQFAKERAAEDKLKADEKRKVTTEFESVQTGIRNDLETPAQQADRELAERLAVIGRYGEQEKLNRDQIRALEVQAESAHQKQITDIRKSEEAARSQTMQSTLSAFGDMFGNLADIAKEGGEKTFKQYKLLASAQAAISAALAITNVLANPLIPYPLNVGLAASVGTLAAVQIAKIQGQSYSAGGGKLYGGPVQAGGMYPVTEDGRPEILKQGNRQYLLPGSRGGEVVSNRDMQPAGGGGGIVINYNPTIYAQDADFEAIMAGQPEAVLNAVRMGLASEGRTL